MRMISFWKAMAAFALLCCLPLSQANSRGAQPASQEKAEEISPVEDLMREHGVLSRVLLIYEEILHRVEQRKGIPSDTLGKAARIIQTFIEQYHEKLEEDYIFPLFEKAGKLSDLTGVLRKQHAAGRVLTQKIIALSNEISLREQKNRASLAECLRQFIRLYRPHKAREETVLFPGLHDIIPESELAALGDKFEDKEKELFGEGGFERMVEAVADLEKNLGIYDLSQFTPK